MYASAMSMLPNVMPQSPISRAPSPSGFSRVSGVSDGLPFRSSALSDFQVERSAKSPPSSARRRTMMPMPQVDDEFAYREAVSKLLAARLRLSTISGLIPMDSSQLVLFFRTKSGITHSLDFPIDVDLNSPPALDVLIAACRPHQTSDFDDYSDNESLFYPSSFPLTTSLEIANLPILDAIRSSLFPLLPQGHYLAVMRDKLEVVVKGGRMGPQPRSLRNDGRVATIVVTLPVRFRGGSFIVRDAEGYEEKYFGRGGKSGDMEWLAFTADCEYEVETVTKGCRITILYGVYLKTFGPTGVTEPLINPSDRFLDLMSPVLNMSLGRRVGIYVTNDYGVNPSEVLAESLVPMLKGGDSVLYHAIKLYKLSPELHWTAGGYIWPVDRTVEIAEQGQTSNSSPSAGLSGLSILDTPRGRVPGSSTPAVRGAFALAQHAGHAGSATSGRAGSVSGRAGSVGGMNGAINGGFGGALNGGVNSSLNGMNIGFPSNAYPESDEDLIDNLRFRVQQSGAIPLGEADITILNDWNNPNPMIGKERVPFVVGGELDKLVVNALMVLCP
ncbi:hypothetical protein J3R30DRAFT_3426911 [Lentinula aciculospora]|uniref:Fe2OG dioxygenase domain-containing protein n=1 Tax=Lentinula aciculospora TaxID=153920 RepID=A0A9W9AUI0_9AGAR|nr:hypothetical protein J3R30DRAFT_3426911 [Lentinula aciculospora]